MLLHHSSWFIFDKRITVGFSTTQKVLGSTILLSPPQCYRVTLKPFFNYKYLNEQKNSGIQFHVLFYSFFFMTHRQVMNYSWITLVLRAIQKPILWSKNITINFLNWLSNEKYVEEDPFWNYYFKWFSQPSNLRWMQNSFSIGSGPLLIHSNRTWNSHLGCGVAFEWSYQALFHGSAK